MFLGPSRKREPRKDSIEARLHQTEVLVGIMLTLRDPYAQSLLRDITRDSAFFQIQHSATSKLRDAEGLSRTQRQVVCIQKACGRRYVMLLCMRLLMPFHTASKVAGRNLWPPSSRVTSLPPTSPSMSGRMPLLTRSMQAGRTIPCTTV